MGFGLELAPLTHLLHHLFHSLAFPCSCVRLDTCNSLSLSHASPVSSIASVKYGFGSFLSVCLSVGVSVCVSVCLFACVSVYLSACLPACLSACLSVFSICSHCLSAADGGGAQAEGRLLGDASAKRTARRDDQQGDAPAADLHCARCLSLSLCFSVSLSLCLFL